MHYTGVAGSGFQTLEEGAKVTYETAQGRKVIVVHRVRQPVAHAGEYMAVVSAPTLVVIGTTRPTTYTLAADVGKVTCRHIFAKFSPLLLTTLCL